MTLTIDRLVQTFALGRDVTYRAMHQTVRDGGDQTLCSWEEGLAVLRLIAAAEQSMKEKKWIEK